MYKSITKKKKKKHKRSIVKLNSVEVVTCEVLIDSHIYHDEFISINNVFKNLMKLKKNSEVLTKNKYV